MSLAGWVVGVMTAVVFTSSAIAVLTWQEKMEIDAHKFGFTRSQYSLIGIAQLAGSGGVVLGLSISSLRPLGAAAAGGLAILALIGGGFHVARKDGFSEVAPAIVLGSLAIASSIALIAAT